MNVFQDAFTENQIDALRATALHPAQSWSSLVGRWHPDLLIGIDGSVETGPVPRPIENLIRLTLTRLYPEYRKDPLHLAFQRYGVGGGVAEHVDTNTTFAATIFLNKNWAPSNGGLFICWDTSGDPRALVPQYNMMLINTAYDKHLVTPVTSSAPEHRLTLQVFGMKENLSGISLWEDRR